MAIIERAEPYFPSLVFPLSDLTPEQKKAIRLQVINGLLKIAQERKIGRPDECVIRRISARLDLTLADDTFITGALNAGANTFTQYVSQALPSNKAFCFYGLVNRDTNPQISVVRYRSGANGAGGTKLILPVEDLYAEEVPGCYHDLVFYAPDETCFIDVRGLAAVTNRLVLLGMVIEKRGENMSGGVI